MNTKSTIFGKKTDMSTDSSYPKVIGNENIASGKFLTLERLHWTDVEGRERQWESAGRVKNVGAVVIIARLSDTGKYVLIRQFRPPANAFVLEFPAGLINEGEDPEVSALRELKEETGYLGVLQKMYPPTFTSPGLTGETVRLALMSIDMSLSENQSPQSSPDPGEFTETILIKSEEALSFIAEEEKRGVLCDSKVMAWFLSLSSDEEDNRKKLVYDYAKSGIMFLFLAAVPITFFWITTVLEPVSEIVWNVRHFRPESFSFVITTGAFFAYGFWLYLRSFWLTHGRNRKRPLDIWPADIVTVLLVLAMSVASVMALSRIFL